LCGEYQGKKQVWFQTLRSKDGKSAYTALNTYKPKEKTDLPF